MTKILGVIPSRLKSSRLNNKPLYKINGIPLIIHVLERAKLSSKLNDIVVATDSIEIKNLVENFGGRAMLTSEQHQNGTERMIEVMKKMPSYEFYTLINGDEILLNPKSIDISVETLIQNEYADASILAVPFEEENSFSDFKIVCNLKNEVLYISRNDIPSSSRNEVKTRLKAYHLMTFRPKTLLEYGKLSKSPLEKIEDHEHLRLIENGYKLICKVVHDKCVSLDTPNDIPIIKNFLQEDVTYKLYNDIKL